MITQTTSRSRKIWLSCCFVLLSVLSGFSQSHATFTIDGFTSTTTTMSFDVYITNDGTTQLRLAAYNVGINHNPAILNNSTLFTTTSNNNAVPFTYQASSRDSRLSTLNALSQVTYQHTANGVKNHMRFGNTPVTLDSGNTVLLETNSRYKLGRFTFTNSNGVIWSGSSNASLAFQLSILATYSNCIATCYVDGATNSTGIQTSVVSGAYVNTPYLLNTCTNTSSTQTVAACGSSYTWPVENGGTGTNYTVAGTYQNVTNISGGCTDTKTLVLTLNNDTASSESQTACDTYTWPVNNQTYTSSGAYTSTSTNAAGCTLTKTLNLTINQSTSSSESQSACGSYTWAVNGQTYSESGTYTSTSTNAAGCTDTKTLVLTIAPAVSHTTNATACDTYTWSVNNQTYTASGNFSVTTGCNTEYLVLVINSSTSHTTPVTSCGTYTWSGPLGDGNTYNTSGTYTHVSTNASGCDHTETLNLTILSETITTQPAAPFICNTVGSTASVSVATNAANATYQWQIRIVTAANPNPVWNNMVNNTVYSGVTTSTLGITRTATAFATGIQYRALVTGSCATLTSNSVALTVILSVKAGTITSPMSVCLGGDITFTLGAYAGTSIQWQSALTNSVAAPGTFANIPGATTNVLTLTGATAEMNKAYRAVVTSTCGAGGSATTAVKLIKVNPLTVAGTATGGGTVCAGGSGTIKLAGYVGTLQWEYSTDGVTYVNAPKSAVGQTTPFTTTSVSSIGASYIVGTISQELYFRAKVTSGACSSLYSNVLHFILGTEASVGTVSAAANTVCSGTGTTLTLSSSVGVITWFKKTVAATTWTATTNHTDTYPTGNLATNYMYKAAVTIGSCSTVESAPITISVSPLPKGGTITPFLGTSYLACANVAKKLKVASTVGTIQWQSSPDNGIYTDIPGANAATYDAVISEATWFRVKAVSGVCASPAYTAIPVQLTISAPASAGTLAAASNPICATTATTVTLSGTQSGTIVWQKSTTFAAATPVWAAVTVTGNTLSTGALSASTAYRVMATSGACVDYSNIVIITVTPKPLAKALTTNTTSPTGATAPLALCNDLSVAKTYTVGAGYVGNIQWQTSVTSATAGFVDIAGETGVSYTVSNPAIGVNYYRAKFSNGSCTDAFGVAVKVYYKDCSSKADVSVSDAAVSSPFSVVAYPNPYSENFNLSLTTSSEEKVGIVVYDMTGRLLERRDVRPGDMSEQQIGNHYPSGVYNVVITQGSEVKTLRVIKR